MVKLNTEAGCPGGLQDFRHFRRRLACSVASLRIHQARCPNP